MRGARLILAAVVVLSGAQSQTSEQQMPTIQVNVDVVNILCSVRDKRGALVSNLTKDDFIVEEDGKPQQIRYFAREVDLPLTIGVLFDVSLSQRNLIETERRAAAGFFASVLRRKDMAFLISFGPEVELVQDFTNSVTLLRNALDTLKAQGSVGGLGPSPVPTIYKPRGTVLFDAVYLAATEKLRQEVGRKAIVLITDGVDQGSRLKLQDALEAAHRADAIIYSIYYVDPSAYFGSRGALLGGVSDADLRKMSDETGGRLFKVSKKLPLEEVFQQIQDEMRSQYAIGYVPANPLKNGSYHRLEVTTRQKDLKVQARKGYYASKDGSS
jgi:VWFA-related protein